MSDGGDGEYEGSGERGKDGVVEEKKTVIERNAYEQANI